MTDYPEFSHQVFTPPPTPAGHWVIGKSSWGQTQFAIYEKPSWFHRKMTRLLLGWEWLDND